MVAVLFVYGNISFFTGRLVGISSLAIIVYTGIVILPALALLLYRRIETGMKDAAKLELQKTLLEDQENTILAMREQRHDIINDITLATTYIQVGKTQEALQCLEFMAANLADKYNYSMLPKDAWLMTLQAKQVEAEKLGIEFTISLACDPPNTINEQRLLPKLTANLIDNAFSATYTARNPKVQVYWKEGKKGRILSIINNGHGIVESEQERLFEPGYTSKDGYGHGWGLVICKRIAEELGGELSCVSNNRETKFILHLKKL